MTPAAPADNADVGTKLTRLAVIAVVAIIGFQMLPILGRAKTGPDPKAIITGPDHVVTGSFITLRGDASVGGTAWEWEVEPKIDGVIQFELIDGGKSIRPASIPGVWKYRLSVWNADKKSDAFHTVTVTGGLPTPPEPSPGPTPVDPVKPNEPKPDDPVKPADPVKPPEPRPAVLNGTAKAVYDFALSVNSPTRAADCREIAADCRVLADRMLGRAEPAITSRRAASIEIGEAMTSLSPAWNDFRSKTGAYLHGLYTNGELATVEAIGKVTEAAAEGFEAAAKVE